MRGFSLIAGLLMITSCYAYEIASIEEFYPTITEESLRLKASIDARLPVESKATAGQEPRHSVTITGFSNAIFIIGDDAFSKQWLSDHAEELKQLKALGFITNIKNTETLHELESKFNLPLLPANIDDFMELLSASHYPLIMSEGVVWQ